MSEIKQVEKGEVSIGEASAQSGVSSRTIRYYEELGLLPGVRRRSAGRRVYGPDELERLRFIGRLKTLGLSLHEIKELNALYALAGSTRAMLQRLDDLLGAHQSDLDGRIDELLGLRDEMSKYREHVANRIDSLADSHRASEASAQPPTPGEIES
jgi:MerR family copper efflux transcriptional regulator